MAVAGLDQRQIRRLVEERIELVRRIEELAGELARATRDRDSWQDYAMGWKAQAEALREEMAKRWREVDVMRVKMAALYELARGNPVPGVVIDTLLEEAEARHAADQER